jgi:hypothetical protein
MFREFQTRVLVWAAAAPLRRQARQSQLDQQRLWAEEQVDEGVEEEEKEKGLVLIVISLDLVNV